MINEQIVWLLVLPLGHSLFLSLTFLSLPFSSEMATMLEMAVAMECLPRTFTYVLYRVNSADRWHSLHITARHLGVVGSVSCSKQGKGCSQIQVQLCLLEAGLTLDPLPPSVCELQDRTSGNTGGEEGPLCGTTECVLRHTSWATLHSLVI